MPTPTSDRVCLSCDGNTTISRPLSSWPTPQNKTCFNITSAPVEWWLNWSSNKSVVANASITIYQYDVVVWQFNPYENSVVSGFNITPDHLFSSVGKFYPTLRFNFTRIGVFSYFDEFHNKSVANITVISKAYYNSCHINTHPMPRNNATYSLISILAYIGAQARAFVNVTVAPVLEDAAGLCNQFTAADLASVLYYHGFSNVPTFKLPDTYAFAITAVNSSNGYFQFSTDGGATWQNMLFVSAISAPVFTAVNDSMQLLRFISNPNWYGTTNFTYISWVLTSGLTPGSFVDTTNSAVASLRPANITGYASLVVQPINDRPSLLASSYIVPNIDEDTPDQGILVSSLVSGQYADNDTDAQIGIAIVGMNNTFGSWEYSCEQKTIYDQSPYNFLPIVANLSQSLKVSSDWSFLLLGSCHLRFNPSPHFTSTLDSDGLPRNPLETPTILIRAWDNTGVTVNMTGTLGYNCTAQLGKRGSPFGLEVASASITVFDIPEIPELIAGSQYGDNEATFVQGAGAIPLFDPVYFSLTNPQSFLLSEITIQFINAVDAPHESILYNTTNMSKYLTVTLTAAATFITIDIRSVTGQDTNTTFFASFLSTFSYINTAPQPSLAQREIRYYVRSGSNIGRASTYIAIQRTESAPYIDWNSTLPGVLGFTEYADNGGQLALGKSGALMYYGNSTVNKVTLAIQSFVLYEYLYVNTTGTNVSASFNRSTGVLVLSPLQYCTNTSETVSECTENVVTLSASFSQFKSVLSTLVYQYPVLPPPPTPAPTQAPHLCPNTTVSANGTHTTTTTKAPTTHVGQTTTTHTTTGPCTTTTSTTTTTTTIPIPPPLYRVRYISATASDAYLTSAPSVLYVGTSASNDPPVIEISGSNGTTVYTGLVYTAQQSSPLNVAGPQLSVIDVDSSTLAFAVVQIANATDCPLETLSVNSAIAASNGISSVFDAPRNALVLTGQASSAAYASVLQSVTYTNTAGLPDALPRVITFLVNDGNSNSSVVSSVVTFSYVNNAPVLQPLAGYTNLTVIQDASDWANPGVAVSDLIGQGTPEFRPRPRFTIAPCSGGCTWQQAVLQCQAINMGLCTMSQISSAWPNGNSVRFVLFLEFVAIPYVFQQFCMASRCIRTIGELAVDEHV